MKTSQERASQQSQTLAPTRFTNPPPFFPQPTSSVLYWECRSLSHPFLPPSFPPPVPSCLSLTLSVSLSLSLSLSTSPFPFLPSRHTHVGCCE